MSTHPHSTTHVATGFPSTHHTEHDNERRPTGDDSDDADIEELDDSDDEEAGPPTQREPHLPDNPAVPPINNAPQSLDIAAATYRSTGPNSRFKSVAMRVMAMHRTSAALRMPGSEPGIDPRRSTAQSQYGHLRQRCSIEVISYGALKATHDVLQNEDLAAYLKKERPVWARVRWIKVGGISWDVIKPLGITFGLHPLTIEDILHARRTSQSKADYYSKHLFLSLLSHSLRPDEGEHSHHRHSPPAYTEQITASPRNSLSSRQQTDTGGWLHRRKGQRDTVAARAADEEHGGAGKREDNAEAVANPEADEKAANIRALEELKRDARVHVEVRNMYIFLLRDGTVISIDREPELEFAAIIADRIRSKDSLLRTTADASFLVQALIDYMVDNSMKIVDKYHEKILRLERDILLKPKVKTVNYLHVLAGDLTTHKRTLTPIKSVIYGLRRYDLDRCIALENSIAGETVDKDKIVGYMSHKSKVYLADVYDHMEYILNSLDMFTSISENLVNYTFNVISYETNQTMRMLTLATITFFPLSFLTGYFGMNFSTQWSVQQHSDAFFWKITIPVLFAIIVIFMWPDIIRAIHFLKKRSIAKRAQQVQRQR